VAGFALWIRRWWGGGHNSAGNNNSSRPRPTIPPANDESSHMAVITIPQPLPITKSIEYKGKT